MILITQTTAPISGGSNVDSNIFDSSGNALNSNGSGALEVAVVSTPGSVNETSDILNMTATPTALGATACTEVTIWLLSSAAASAAIEINSGIAVILEPGYSMVIKVNDLSKIEASQPGGEGDTLYFKYL